MKVSKDHPGGGRGLTQEPQPNFPAGGVLIESRQGGFRTSLERASVLAGPKACKGSAGAEAGSATARARGAAVERRCEATGAGEGCDAKEGSGSPFISSKSSAPTPIWALKTLTSACSCFTKSSSLSRRACMQAHAKPKHGYPYRGRA